MKKSKFTKLISKEKNRVGLILILFILISPWLWVLIRNSNIDMYKNIKLINFKDEAIIDQINISRGEMSKTNVPSIFGRIIVNKVSFYSIEVTKRYLETFDPQYLFFNGDLDMNKSTRSNGPLYLSFLPLLLIGIYSSILNKDKLKLYLLGIFPLIGAFIENHYESITRIPVFILLSYFSSYGLIYLYKRKKWLALLIVFLILFEFSRFVHDFLIHYPGRLNL